MATGPGRPQSRSQLGETMLVGGLAALVLTPVVYRIRTEARTRRPTRCGRRGGCSCRSSSPSSARSSCSHRHRSTSGAHCSGVVSSPGCGDAHEAGRACLLLVMILATIAVAVRPRARRRPSSPRRTSRCWRPAATRRARIAAAAPAEETATGAGGAAHATRPAAATASPRHSTHGAAVGGIHDGRPLRADPRRRARKPA